MNTIFFVAAGVLAVLIIMSKIPGLEHAVKPVIGLLFDFVKFIAENALSWTLWTLKLLLASHLELLKNLLMSAEALDPTVAVRAQSSDEE